MEHNRANIKHSPQLTLLKNQTEYKYIAGLCLIDGKVQTKDLAKLGALVGSGKITYEDAMKIV